MGLHPQTLHGRHHPVGTFWASMGRHPQTLPTCRTLRPRDGPPPFRYFLGFRGASSPDERAALRPEALSASESAAVFADVAAASPSAASPSDERLAV